MKKTSAPSGQEGHEQIYIACLSRFIPGHGTKMKSRIMRYLQDLNSDPVVFRWRYKLEEESVS